MAIVAVIPGNAPNTMPTSTPKRETRAWDIINAIIFSLPYGSVILKITPKTSQMIRDATTEIQSEITRDFTAFDPFT